MTGVANAPRIVNSYSDIVATIATASVSPFRMIDQHIRVLNVFLLAYRLPVRQPSGGSPVLVDPTWLLGAKSNNQATTRMVVRLK